MTSDESCTESDYECDDYYNTSFTESQDEINHVVDVEHFDFQCLTTDQVKKMLNDKIHVVSPIAKVGLRTSKKSAIDNIRHAPTCSVCFESEDWEKFRHLQCRHLFCVTCWLLHFETQLSQGVSTEIECMETGCNILVPEHFALDILTKSDLKVKYNQFRLRDCVRSNPQLRFCPGPNCSVIIRAEQPKSGRVTCSECNSVFCFKCASDYHAPTDCVTIKKWRGKLEESSELANYLLENTKDCPNCYHVIEKNGGCNHMYCSQCKFNFCWMCLGDWKTHGTAYYQCSTYNADPNVVLKSQQEVRAATKRFEFYFDRWKNHEQSIALEEETLEKIRVRSEQKVMNGEGSWIDWQYLFDAAALLRRCRYTLKYAYVYAYYMECGVRKVLFEYQQGQLEAVIENLSWEIERVENVQSRAKMEARMSACEKMRAILLAEFGGWDLVGSVKRKAEADADEPEPKRICSE